jgi:hypothetical protein
MLFYVYSFGFFKITLWFVCKVYFNCINILLCIVHELQTLELALAKCHRYLLIFSCEFLSIKIGVKTSGSHEVIESIDMFRAFCNAGLGLICTVITIFFFVILPVGT